MGGRALRPPCHACMGSSHARPAGRWGGSSGRTRCLASVSTARRLRHPPRRTVPLRPAPRAASPHTSISVSRRSQPCLRPPPLPLASPSAPSGPQAQKQYASHIDDLNNQLIVARWARARARVCVGWGWEVGDGGVLVRAGHAATWPAAACMRHAMPDEPPAPAPTSCPPTHPPTYAPPPPITPPTSTHHHPHPAHRTNSSIMRSELQKAALEALVEVRRETLNRAFSRCAYRGRGGGGRRL